MDLCLSLRLRLEHGLTGEVDKRAIPGISWNSSLGWEGSMAFR
jgi:hypothetical protein